MVIKTHIKHNYYNIIGLVKNLFFHEQYTAKITSGQFFEILMSFLKLYDFAILTICSSDFVYHGKCDPGWRVA